MRRKCLLAKISNSGADLAAERERWNGIEAQITRNASRIIGALGGTRAYATLRANTGGDASHPIWQLDALLAAQRARQLRKIGLTFAVIAMLLLAGYLLRDTLFPPDPIGDATRGALVALENNDPQAALTRLDSALTLSPTQPTLLLWKGVVLEQLHDPRSVGVFQQASALIPAEDLLFERAVIYASLGRGLATLTDIEAVLSLNPNRPEAYFVQATGFELTDQRDKAIAALQKTAELAEAQDNSSLYASARVRLAQVMQASGPN